MKNLTETYHVPVMVDESLGGLDIKSSGIYVDATFGGGGHSRRLLERLGRDGRLLGVDQDEDAERNILEDERFMFVRSNFKYLYNFMRYYGVLGKVDGLLADLGVSSHHFDEPERGFSFRHPSNLDMRMNAREGLTAADVLNTYKEDALANVFFFYGELRNARQLASAVIKSRREKTIKTSEDLLGIASKFIPKEREKKFLAQLYQALRIEVNREIDALRDMLMQTTKVLKPGGRVVVITYHSLEDRLVKNFFRSGNFEGRKEEDFYGNVISPFKVINSRVVTPSDDEMTNNPRSRSAKLRIAEVL